MNAMTLARCVSHAVFLFLAVACSATRIAPPRPAQTADGRKAYLFDARAERVMVIDRWNGGIEATLPLDGRARDVLVSERAQAAVISVDGMGGRPGCVVFLNLASNAITAEVREGVGAHPGDLALSPDGRLLYVANPGARDISVIALDARPPRVVQRLPVGAAPQRIEGGWPAERLWVVTGTDEEPRSIEVTGVEAWLPAPPGAEDPARSKTEVLVLGMIHDGHRTSPRWGLAQVEQTIRAFDPDAVLCEIPPDRWERARDEYTATGRVEEPRVRRFPEYVDVLLPLRAELGFVVEACAAWTKEMNDLRNRRLKALETDPALAALRDAYEHADSEVAAALAADPIVEDDPRVIHTDAYDARTRLELGPYDRFLDRYIGPGGWTAINRAHLARIEEALDRHRGERVLITFGAGHKEWILRRLRERADIRLMEAAPFLPPASPH